jgi:hypothetical protein
MSMIRQRLLATMGGLALTAGILAGVTPVAQAALVDVTCAGTDQITYSPGLLLQAQTVHFSETDLYGLCTSSDPAITSGTGVISDDLPASCLTPLLTGTFSYTLTWNTGQTSQFLLTVANTVAGGVTTSVASGNVTAGEFQGDTVKAVLTYAQLNLLQCLSPPGITNQAGALTLVINGS